MSETPSGRHAKTGFLVVRSQPTSPAAEAYRSMRTSLQMLSQEKQGSLVVTSCSPSDGKTFCAVNLAIALAATGKRVLLVDADLRRPMVHNIFHLGRATGLSEVLSQQALPEEAVHGTEVPGLDIVPSGPIPPNPSELLGMPTVGPVFERWQAEYAHVLFDAPPLLGLSDAVVLAREVGRAILVVRFGVTSDSALRRATDVLRGAAVEILGVVINGARAGDGDVYGAAHGYAPAAYLDGMPRAVRNARP